LRTAVAVARGADAIGIGSFGPLEGNPASPTWGYITTTPKPGWAQTDFWREIKRRLGVPVAFDTDVNAAALGEHRRGASQGLDTCCYITVGTGIGGGGLVGGKLLHELRHPEFGHMRIPHDRPRGLLGRRVVIGGGVMNRPGLLGLVQSQVVGLMNGYLDAPVFGDGIPGFVTAPALGPRAGVLGALALAASA
jgi:hypothetical protein